MAFDFPTSPAENQEYTSGGVTYVFKSPGWKVKTGVVSSDDYVKKIGDTMSGDLLINKTTPALRLDTLTLADSPRIVGRKAGTNRWLMDFGVNIAESGGNSGSNFWITRANDAGVAIDVPFQITRSDGSIGLSGTLNIDSGKIKWPATQNPSADVNTLDDYEEGTFVPSLTFGGAAVGMTYANQFGIYTKVGRFVFVTVFITLTAKGSSVGLANIGGLPFANPTNYSSFGFSFYQGMASLTGTPIGHMGPGSTGISPYQTGAASVGQLTDANFTSTANFTLAGSYQTTT